MFKIKTVNIYNEKPVNTNISKTSYETIEKAQNALIEKIKNDVTKYNSNDNSENKFKITFESETSLAVLQMWEGKDKNLSKIELEGDRNYWNIIEYDIVYSDEEDCLLIDTLENILPPEWIN